MTDNSKSPIDLLIEVQDNQLKVVGGHRLAVLKAQDDFKKFRGEDDYQIAVTTIVKEYPEGIVLTRLREVLPDSVILEKAVKSLVEKKEITTESYGKRTQLLKPLHKPAKDRVESVDTNPTGKPEWETVPASEPTPKKPTPKPAKPAEDDTQE